ncbi:MAG: hypothetical protein R3C18_17780 [Planctomycetaceae bacterium]
MHRHALTHGLLAVAFATIGLFQLTTAGHLSVSEGSLVTISQLQAEMESHLDKEDGRLDKNDGRLTKVDESVLDKGDGLFKETGLSADLF